MPIGLELGGEFDAGEQGGRSLGVLGGDLELGFDIVRPTLIGRELIGHEGANAVLGEIVSRGMGNKGLGIRRYGDELAHALILASPEFWEARGGKIAKFRGSRKHRRGEAIDAG